MYPGVEMLEIAGNPSLSTRNALAHKQQGWRGFPDGLYDLGHEGAIELAGMATYYVQPGEGCFDVFFCFGQTPGRGTEEIG